MPVRSFSIRLLSVAFYGLTPLIATITRGAQSNTPQLRTPSPKLVDSTDSTSTTFITDSSLLTHLSVQPFISLISTSTSKAGRTTSNEGTTRRGPYASSYHFYDKENITTTAMHKSDTRFTPMNQSRHSITLSNASVTPGVSKLLSHHKSNNDSSFPGIITRTVGWQECQASLVAWSESWSYDWVKDIPWTLSTKTFPAWNSTTTSTRYFTNSTFSPPYTTIDGWPHVKGSFTFTTFSMSVWYDVTLMSASASVETTDPYNISSPTCVIPITRCSMMWSSYLSSLGLPFSDLSNAVEPRITPVPSNRPRCSLGDPELPCSTQSFGPLTSCAVIGSGFKLMYWPPETNLGNATSRHHDTAIVTAHYGTHVLTSPTVYLAHPSLTLRGTAKYQTSCSTSYIPLGASPAWPSVRGSNTNIIIPASVVSLRSEDVSSIQWKVNQSLVSSSGYILGGPPSEHDVTLPVNFSALQQPTPEAYYMAIWQNWATYGIKDYIFDDLYAPILAVNPALLYVLPVEFRDCSFFAFFFDPPSALQPAMSVAAATFPTLRPVFATDLTTSSQTPYTQPASPERNSPTPLPRSTTVHTWTTSALASSSQSTPDVPLATESIGSHTVRFSSLPGQSIAVIKASGRTWTAFASDGARTISIASTILSVGGSAGQLGGTRISAASNGIIVGSQIVSYSRHHDKLTHTSARAVTTIVDGNTLTIAAIDASSGYVVDGSPLSIGGPAATINRERMSAATDGLVLSIGGSVRTISDEAMSAATDTQTHSVRHPVVTINGKTVSAVSDSFALSIGGSAVTVNGEVISAATNGLVLSITDPIVTIDGETVIAATESLVLSVEGPAVTINGEILSAATNGLVIAQEPTKTTMGNRATTTMTFSPDFSKSGHPLDLNTDLIGSQSVEWPGERSAIGPTTIVRSGAMRNGVKRVVAVLAFGFWWLG